MRFRRLAFVMALALAGASGCRPSKPECPTKKYEPPDERFIFFSPGKADVSSDGHFAIGYVAGQLDADAALRVLVVGHADQQGKADVNREISLKRARVVRKVLVDHGVKPERIQIAAPREHSSSSDAQLSRRVDLFVYDPAQDDATKRIGYPVDVKPE